MNSSRATAVSWVPSRSGPSTCPGGLRPVESNNDKAPVYEIVALNVGNRWVQVGALWEAVAKHTTGEVFLQGSIDDPSLAEPLPVALFGTEEEGYRVAWRRPQRRDDFGPAIRTARRDDAPKPASMLKG